ncbi:MAG: DUF507 family protein [bacterium]
MKLRKPQIERISGNIIKELIESEFIEVPNQELLHADIIKVITDDLEVEDKLNEEVKEILDNYATQMAENGAEYHRVFNMVKAKMIREKGLVL